jgi:hypothetical protein
VLEPATYAGAEGLLLRITCRGSDPHMAGAIDLFVANGDPQATGEVDCFYRNNGQGGFDRQSIGDATSSVANSFNVAWVDYDLDGHLDLFVARCARLTTDNIMIVRV